jgi:hypothetical protein
LLGSFAAVPGDVSVVALGAFGTEVNCVERVKDTDFERAMKLVTTRIDVQDDDKLMQLVFKEAKDIGALQFAH